MTSTDNTSKRIEEAERLDNFVKWCNLWGVRLEELFYYRPYMELRDKITFNDLERDTKGEVRQAFKELLEQLQKGKL